MSLYFTYKYESLDMHFISNILRESFKFKFFKCLILFFSVFSHLFWAIIFPILSYKKSVKREFVIVCRSPSVVTCFLRVPLWRSVVRWSCDSGPCGIALIVIKVDYSRILYCGEGMDVEQMARTLITSLVFVIGYLVWSF